MCRRCVFIKVCVERSCDAAVSTGIAPKRALNGSGRRPPGLAALPLGAAGPSCVTESVRSYCCVPEEGSAEECDGVLLDSQGKSASPVNKFFLLSSL